MAILNIQVSSIGQSGQSPSFIYIQTNNTVDEVQDPDFLRGVISEGIPISDTQMALVSTKLTPSAKASQVGLYSITGGALELIAGGQDPGPFFSTQGNSDLNSETFLGSTNEEPLILGVADTDVITIFPQGVDNPDIIIGNLGRFEMTASTEAIISSPIVNLDTTGGTLKMEGLAQSSTGNTLYYNSGTDAITWDAAPGGGSDWNLAGTNSGAGLLLGTNTTDGFDVLVNSVVRIGLTDTDINLGTIAGTDAINIGSATVDIVVNAANFNMEADGPRIDNSFGALNAVRIANSNATQLTLGNTSCAIDMASTTLTWNGSGASNLHCTAALDIYGSEITIGTTVSTDNTIGRLASGVTSTIRGEFVDIVSTDSSSIDAGTNVAVGAVNANNIYMGSPTCHTEIEATDLNFISLPNTAQSNLVMYNTGSGAVSYDSVGNFASGFWNTSGNTGAGLKLGTTDSNDLQLFCNNFAFMTCDATANVDFGVNTFAVDLLNVGQAITIENPHNSGPEFILLTCGGPANDTNLFVRPLTIELFSKLDIELQATEPGATITLNGENLVINGTDTAIFQLAGIDYINVDASMNVTIGAADLSIGATGSIRFEGATVTDIVCPALNINTEAVTNVTTIGNVLANNDVLINSAKVQAPNIPTQTSTPVPPTNTPAAGYNYLVISAAGLIEQFAP
jgi:hypothetical protein